MAVLTKHPTILLFCPLVGFLVGGIPKEGWGWVSGGRLYYQAEWIPEAAWCPHQSTSWNQHIRDGKESVLRQLISRVNGLRKLAPRAGFKPKLMLANGIVISKLSYGLAVWGSCQEYLRRALQVQQLTAAQSVCDYKSYFWSTTKLLTTCWWLSVNQLYWF